MKVRELAYKIFKAVETEGYLAVVGYAWEEIEHIYIENNDLLDKDKPKLLVLV